MNMVYQIVTGIPVKFHPSGFSFEILLWPAWKELVQKIPITWEDLVNWNSSVGNSLLDSCGYGGSFPDLKGQDEDPNQLPLRLYDATRGAIVISWGEWGPEHISIPGNGCGLDISPDSLHCPEGGNVLQCHNVDTMQQAYLLQLIFNWFANYLTSTFAYNQKYNQDGKSKSTNPTGRT